MFFANPWIFLILGPLGWLLWWLEQERLKPRPVTIAHWALLPELALEEQATQRQDLRWESWLRGALLLLLVAIAAQPRRSSAPPKPTERVLIIDRSARTLAKQSQAWSSVQARARASLSSLNGHHPVLVLWDPPERQAFFRGTAQTALAELARMKPSQLPSQLDDLVPEARSLSLGDVAVIAAEARLSASQSAGLQLSCRAEQGVNVGWVAASSRALSATQQELRASLWASKERRGQVEFEVQVQGGGFPRSWRTHTLSTNRLGIGVFNLSLPRTVEAVALRLKQRDDLALDDALVLLKAAERPFVVSTRGVMPEPVRRVFGALPGIDLESDEAGSDDVRAGLSVIREPSLDALPTPSVLLWPPSGSDAAIENVVAECLEHPLWGPAQLKPVTIKLARATPPPGLGTLTPLMVDGEGHVLVGLRGEGRDSFLYIGFLPSSENGDWTRQESFPLLMASFAEAALAYRESILRVHRLGAARRLESLGLRPSFGAQLDGYGPSGRRRVLTSEALWRPVEVGVHEFRESQGGLRQSVSVAFLNLEVTQLRSQQRGPERIDLGRAGPESEARARASDEWVLWPSLLALLLWIALMIVVERGRRI